MHPYLMEEFISQRIADLHKSARLYSSPRSMRGKGLRGGCEEGWLWLTGK